MGKRSKRTQLMVLPSFTSIQSQTKSATSSPAATFSLLELVCICPTPFLKHHAQVFATSQVHFLAKHQCIFCISLGFPKNTEQVTLWEARKSHLYSSPKLFLTSYEIFNKQSMCLCMYLFHFQVGMLKNLTLPSTKAENQVQFRGTQQPTFLPCCHHTGILSSVMIFQSA